MTKVTSEHPTARYMLRLPKLRLLVSHLDVCSLSCSDIHYSPRPEREDRMGGQQAHWWVRVLWSPSRCTMLTSKDRFFSQE